MTELLILLIALTFSYVVIWRRIVDVYMLAACGLAFYYAGMLVLGYTLDINDSGRMVFGHERPLSWHLILYIAVTLICLVYYSVIDNCLARAVSVPKKPELTLRDYTLCIASLGCVLLIVLIIIYRLGGNFTLSKLEITALAGPYVTIFVYVYAIAVFSYMVVRCQCGFAVRLQADAAMVLATLFGLIILDHKMGILIPLLTVLAAQVFHKRLTVKGSALAVLVACVFTLVVLAKKLIYEQVTIIGLLSELEGFFTASLGNYLISEGHYVDSLYLIYSPLFMFPVLKSLSGYSSTFFNETFQPVYFPNADFGMAYNLYAELYSTGICLLLLLMFCFLLFPVNMVSRSLTGFWRFSVIYLMFYCVFFLHRQSIFVLLSIVGNYFVIFTAIFLVSLLMKCMISSVGAK